MFDKDFTRQLKQVNVSVNKEKTMQRVAELWKAGSTEDKEKVTDLAGVARTTVYRVFKTGSLSVKLAMPLAQVFNVDPRYLTGETDEAASCSEQELRDFLISHGYEKLMSADAKPQADKRRAVRAKSAESSKGGFSEVQAKAELLAGLEEPAEKITVADTVPNHLGVGFADLRIAQPSAAALACVDSLSEEELTFLLKSLMLRAKAGGQAKELARLVKLILIS